jgi:hypothetical protein
MAEADPGEDNLTTVEHGKAVLSRNSNWESIWLPDCCGDACRGD